MNLLRRTGFFCFLVQWSVNIFPSDAYFQSTFDGYTFSIPDYKDQEWRTQADAQTWCIGNQSRLLEITSDSIQRSVVSFFSYAVSQNQMSGNPVITNGKRSTTANTWVNGIVYSSSMEVKGQGQGISYSYGYLSLSQSGFEYYVDVPTATRGYICEGSSLCPNGLSLNGRCFKINSEKLSWFDARNRCLNGGEDLAVFDFIADVKGFSALNGSGWNPPSSYWIGLKRMNWTWQGSNSDLRYSQWANGHPDFTGNNYYSECVCLQPSDWKWIECGCGYTYQLVCITGTPSTSTATSSTTSSSTTPSGTTPSSTAPSSTTPSSTTTSTTSRSTISGMSSTTLTTAVSRTSSLNPPTYSSSVSDSGVTVITELQSSTSANASVSGGNAAADNSLAIGLGVGIGGGVLLITIILIVVVTVKRKGCPRKSERQNASYVPPDVTSGGAESTYATVVKNPQYDDVTLDINAIPPPPEYADLRIVRGSRRPKDVEKKRRSFV